MLVLLKDIGGRKFDNYGNKNFWYLIFCFDLCMIFMGFLKDDWIVRIIEILVR